MKTTLEIAEAQAQLPRLVRSKKTVTICRHGETVAFLLPRERMESIFETLEIQSNPEAMKAIRRAKSGKGSTFRWSSSKRSCMKRKVEADPQVADRLRTSGTRSRGHGCGYDYGFPAALSSASAHANSSVASAG